MKKLLSILVILLVVVGCGSKENISTTENSCQILNVYNWGEYIGEDVIAKFEDEYKVKVNYSLFDSNEAMYTKIMSGSLYDIIIPSDYTVERLINEKYLLKLNKDLIPSYSLLDKQTLNRDFDPNNDYSIPYFWGNIGIVYNSAVIDQKDVESQGWEVLRNPKYSGKIYMYDSERDSFMVAFKALGYSMNTEDENQINEAYNWLQELHNTMKPAYVTDEAIDGLINNEKEMGFMYSGDAATITAANPNMKFFVPANQGTNYWLDAMVIPANSKCPELAHKFIDFMLRNENAYDNSLTVGYTSSNAEVVKELSETEFKGNNAYLPKPMGDKDEVFKFNEVLKEKLSELWIKVKNQ